MTDMLYARRDTWFMIPKERVVRQSSPKVDYLPWSRQARRRNQCLSIAPERRAFSPKSAHHHGALWVEAAGAVRYNPGEIGAPWRGLPYCPLTDNLSKGLAEVLLVARLRRRPPPSGL